MERGFLQELGWKIRIVEEVETNEYGECIGEFVRIRILIDITQPLEKILFLKQEGDADVPMPIVYERLPDVCFCCGVIGHQFKECAKYQGQREKELLYGLWIKTVTVGGRSRKHRVKK